MTKVLFVCLGNIYRSPMAEFVLKDMVNKKGVSKDFLIESSATSTEEIGNTMHIGTRRKLQEKGIDFTEHMKKYKLGVSLFWNIVWRIDMLTLQIAK